MVAQGTLAATEPATPSLEFIENKGQWDARVRYAAPLLAGRLFAQADGLVYAFVDPAALKHGHSEKAMPHTGPAANRLAAHAYTVHFEGASARTRLTAETPTSEVRNYFLGSDASKWASHVGSFRRLRYQGLWAGVDMTLYENAGQHLEYDIELAPHANAARVALRYDGAEGLTLDAAGNLVVKTSVRTVTELAPQAWQTDAAGQRQPVPCRFVLTGSTLTFALGKYDHRRALTIDPTVLFSSFSGSTADNWGFTASYDLQGNMYSGGIVFAQGYPATNGAFSTQFSGQYDIALIKYNTTVNGAGARAWATYLGGSSGEQPHSLVTNARGELVLLGSTSSTNYPTTTGALQRTFGGGSQLDPFGILRFDNPAYNFYLMPNGADLVVTRLSAGGDALLASTYLGGSGNDGVQNRQFSLNPDQQLSANYGDAFRGDVLLDGNDNVYLVSNTTSANFPGLSGPGFNDTYRGGASDAVVCQLPPGLNAVGWAGLLGGSGADAAYSIQRDATGRVFVCGGTTSPTLPATASGLHPGPQGGVDGWVARIAANGLAVEKASFIGTARYDQAQFLQLDNDGDVYLLGQTMGLYPRTPGIYGISGATQYIQKLSPDLDVSRYSTTFGPATVILPINIPPNLVPTAFLVDDCERVYISGWGGAENDQGRQFIGGSTSGLPTTAGAVKTTTDGSDFYLAQFTAGMTSLEYATFYGISGVGPNGEGGEHVDGGTSRFDKRGVVYQAVCGGCSSNLPFPVPPGANSYSPTNRSGNCNNAAFKIDFGRQIADPGPRRAACLENGPVPLGGTPAGGVWSGIGVQPGPGGVGYQFSPAVAGPGRHLLTYSVATTGVCRSTTRVLWTVPATANVTFAPVVEQCVSGAALPLVATPAGGSFSGPGVSGTTFNPVAAGPGTHTITYTLCDSIVGSAVVTRQVTVSPAPRVVAGRDTTLCADLIRPFQLQGQSPANGIWSGLGVSPTGYFTPPNTNNRGGSFELTYTVTQPPCTSTAIRRVVLAPASLTDAPLNLPTCPAAPGYAGLAPLTVSLSAQLPGGVYDWDFGDGSPHSIEQNPSHRYEEPGSYRIRLTARYSGCEVLTQFAPLEVGRVYVPNIITPSAGTAAADSLNEAFRPRFSCRPASLKVFSRWGHEVFQTNDYRNNWNAEGLSSGVYYYILKDDEGRVNKGWVEVRR